MRASWLASRDESWARAAALLPLAGASWIYGGAARLHRGLYRAGLWRRSEFSGYVVGVGSLLVGGSGKTPVAAWIAGELHRRGRKVVLASRGYRRGLRPLGRAPVVVVSDGRFVRSRAEEAGDEPMLLAAHAPGVPVLVGENRARVALRALSAFGAEVVVLDDGFQHHRLRKDVDIAVVDGRQGFGNGWVLPRGPLREPVSALRYAHAVGIVDGPLASRDDALLERFTPLAHRFAARRRAVGIRPLAGGVPSPPDGLAGLEVGLLAGIARPASLRESVESLGARVVAQRLFPDHHRYRESDLRGLARQAPAWVTTEKDAVKLVSSWAGRADVRVLSIQLEVEEPNAFLDWLELRLR